jgi:hypothetical protein
MRALKISAQSTSDERARTGHEFGEVKRRHQVTASASRKHDVPNATSDGLAPTSTPNGGDDYACADAGGFSSPAVLQSPALRKA